MIEGQPSGVLDSLMDLQVIKRHTEAMMATGMNSYADFAAQQ